MGEFKVQATHVLLDLLLDYAGPILILSWKATHKHEEVYF